MNKIFSNFNYKLKYQAPWVLIYLGIFAFVIFIAYFILIQTGVINPLTGSLGYRLFGMVLLQFALSLRFKEDFDFFLTLSSTRKQIFFTLALNSIVYSAVAAIFIVLERLLIDSLNTGLGLVLVKDVFYQFSPYQSRSVFLQFFYFFTLSFCFSAFGTLAGSLFYRFGKKFTITFWLVFASLPSLVLPFALLFFYKGGSLSKAASNLGGFLSSFNVGWASVLSLVFCAVFAAAAYLNIRRLPQRQ